MAKARRSSAKSGPVLDASGAERREAWDGALSSFRVADRAFSTYYREKYLPGARGGGAGRREQRYNRLFAVQVEAFLRLLNAPAPDVAAVALKMELALRDEVGGEFTESDSTAMAILEDLRRLAD